MLRIAGPAAEGLEFVFPYDPTRDDPVWTGFRARFETFESRRMHSPRWATTACAFYSMRFAAPA